MHSDTADRSSDLGAGGSTPRWGWWLCWFLFASTVLNYMDRQAVSVVGERITGEFRVGYEELGWIIAAFQLPYALFQVPAGFIADVRDVRLTYAAAVIWWSIAAMAVAWSPTLGALMAFRAVLGIGESFNWPCALRVTATVLRPADRGLGNGIFNSGAAVGAVLTPLIIVPLTLRLGWRTAFALIGASGLVWVVAWLFAVFGPARVLFASEERPVVVAVGMGGTARWAFSGLLLVGLAIGLVGYRHEATLTLTMPVEGGTVAAWRVAEGETIRKGTPVVDVTRAGATTTLLADGGGVVIERAGGAGASMAEGMPILRLRIRPLGLSAFWLAVAWLMFGVLAVARLVPMEGLGKGGWAEGLGEVVRLRRFWVLALVSVSINVCWHFLINWLPTYLKTDRGMDFAVGSMLSAVPFLAADAGNLGGGAASRWLARRGMASSRARGIVLTACVFLIAAGAGVGWIRDDGLTMVLLAVMALGTAAFMANYFAYCQEVSSRRTGLVVGILGGLGNLFAAGLSPIAGRIKDTSGGFGPVFLVVGLLPFLGLAAILIGWGRDTESPPGPEAG